VKERLKFIDNIKDKLSNRKDQLLKQVANLSHEKVSDGQVSDSGDEALALTMEKLQNSLEETEVGELRRIDEALDRIDKEEYGVCIDCGEPISERRLQNYPYASRCIICQEARES